MQGPGREAVCCIRETDSMNYGWNSELHQDTGQMRQRREQARLHRVSQPKNVESTRILHTRGIMA